MERAFSTPMCVSEVIALKGSSTLTHIRTFIKNSNDDSEKDIAKCKKELMMFGHLNFSVFDMFVCMCERVLVGPTDSIK